MGLQLCAGLAACKVVSDIATRTLAGTKCLLSACNFPVFRVDRQPFNALRSPVRCGACWFTQRLALALEVKLAWRRHNLPVDAALRGAMA